MSKPSRRASRAAQRNLGRPQPAGAPESSATRPAGSTPNVLRGPSGAGTPARPVGSRAGRREQRRPYKRPLTERFRGPLITIAVLAAIALLGVFFVFSATAKTYACGQIWDPAPTGSPAPGASPQLGYVQPDMGNSHNVAQPQTYAYCPPASGNHINNPPSGPIPGRVYGPDDYAQPTGWIHNLEHGGRVVLYKCPGPACDDAGQAQLKAFFQQLPNPANCATVVARFDDMNWPYAAIVWDRVLPLQTLDTTQITAFFNLYAQKTNPEAQCPRPSASPGPSASAGASASPAASGSPATSAAPSGSAKPSASPS